ncbi:uncharacterized protein F4807DRAFT_451052 [Annulohypoxylon truncatum]|uniref:uncharacterized protein n=1 Tax=Annulohypoxylon truncatum TaxID=327061 RepID=UPI00200841BA|nr:uncharacterized protein F4807DRAFT_451052 [Annulohypoxylon truncatum]KAI1211444.1 hypothetical protein F4807DRAFT_451052 [Annulohypoxylon truncatum]
MCWTSRQSKLLVSTNRNAFLPTQPFSSALPFEVDLNFNEAITSSPSSPFNTATISSQDSPVFTTDSHQSSWLPPSSQSQLAQPEQSFLAPPEEDFVLFEPKPQEQNANRATPSPALHAAFGSLNTNASQSPQLFNGSSLQGQQRNQSLSLAQVIQATGHQTSSQVFTNPYTAQPHLFAAAALSPSTSSNSQNRLVRPPVPLFPQNTGTRQASSNMDLQDAMRFEDLTGGGTTAYSSPGMPGYDVSMGSTPGSMGNMATVSPSDLHYDAFSSAPNSAAITNLTSPSLSNESPDYLESYEASPLVGGNDLDGNFFPELSMYGAIPGGFPTGNGNLDSEVSPVDQPEGVEMTKTVSRSRIESSGSPLARTHVKRVSEGGITKPKKPLPAITVEDQHDTVAMKRARNTLAARKSRARKAERFEQLEKQIADLKERLAYYENLCKAHGLCVDIEE